MMGGRPRQLRHGAHARCRRARVPRRERLDPASVERDQGVCGERHEHNDDKHEHRGAIDGDDCPS